MLLKRFAMASLVGSATVLAGCGRPATLAATPAQFQPDPAALAQAAATAKAQDQAAGQAAPIVTAELQAPPSSQAGAGPEAAVPGAAASGTAAPGAAAPEGTATTAEQLAANPDLSPTAPEFAATDPAAADALAQAGEAAAADALAAGALADGATLAADGQAATEGGMSAQFWWLIGRRPTPPPVGGNRPTPPPIYTPPPVRPTPPPIYTPPPVRPTPPPIYTPPPVRPTPPPPVTSGSRVYGTVGNAWVNLARETGNDNISGSLDGRSVYLTVGTGRLSGSIGSSSNVYLTKQTGNYFMPGSVSGSVGNRSLSLKILGRNTWGTVGSVYFDTTISSDDRTLTGRYGGSSVNVRTSGSTTSGYLGSQYVSISKSYDGHLTGYVGTKRIDLAGDVGPGGLLRRLPLIAADDWLVFSTMTRFFI